ncbi:hypothetical protein ACJMK2_009663 [Sinanodonta woodiana]|uniref:NFX1-type zinc finger-containing protein 1 n=1 Tax=Sinanodonta woodiana TaxID=1069815 RepID=A0ABD3VEJ7_SINWO
MESEDDEAREKYPIPIYMSEYRANDKSHNVKQNKQGRYQISDSFDVHRTSPQTYQKGDSSGYSNESDRCHHRKPQSTRRKEIPVPTDELMKTDMVGNPQDAPKSENAHNPGISNYHYRTSKFRGSNARGNNARGERTLLDGRGFKRITRVANIEHGESDRTVQESSLPRQENPILECDKTTQFSINIAKKKQCHEADSARSSRWKLGYRALKDILEMEDVEELVLKLSNVRGGFPECLKEAVKPDWVVLIVSIFQKACLSHKHTYVLEAFHLLHASNFLEKVGNVLSEVQLKSITTKGIWAEKLQLSNFLESLLCVLKKELELIPDSLVKCNTIIMHLNEIVKIFNIGDLRHDIVQNLRMLEEIKEAIRQERDTREQQQRQAQTANKAEGKYKNLDDYLDIQFRLLREDYVKPLRDGIEEYHRNLDQGDTSKRSQGLRLYRDVNICSLQCSSSGIVYILHFNERKFKNMNWHSSRRLLHGSLVALTNDDFETILFATITNRDARELEKGFVQVRFENQLDRVVNITPNEIFVMAETPAYFEAYRHIMKGLQEIQSSMPFQKYFVECQIEISPSKYLLSGVRLYDFTPLVKQTIVTDNCKEIRVLTTTRWPRSDELGLDSSQYNALQTALTKELAVIQGPPGTGKTFVGLKITELLLHNHSVWKENDEINPMLVVCYTNHALDQFLEGILRRCNNESLKPFLLRELKMTRRKERLVPLNIFRAQAQCRDHLKILKNSIESIGVKLQACLLGIMSAKKLQHLMTHTQFESLQKGVHNDIDKCLLLWLDITPAMGGKDDADEYMDSLHKRWETAILQTQVCMDMQEAEQYINVWDLPLVDRVRMYKLWVHQMSDVLKNQMDELRKHMISHSVSPQDLQLLEELKTTESDCQQSIVNEQVLKKFLQKKGQMQIRSLWKVPKNFSNNKDLIKEWLCLEITSKNEAVIENALKEIYPEAYPEEIESEESDLEEDRALDDDDEDIFSVENNASNKTNTRELNQRLKEDLALTFTTETKNENHSDDANYSWQTVSDRKKVKRRIQKVLTSGSSMSEAEAKMVTDVWSLATNKRHELYRYWLNRYRQDLKVAVSVYENEYTKEINKVQEVNDDECLSVLKSCKVIGMTTTGAAKYRHLIQSVKPKIIIVEEAAEVLESHIITTLNPECQHLILIGDHQQLRPTPCVYELAKKYHLDISLFERLVKNGINCITLLEQHRMRPEISVLVKHIYPNLRDHSRVRQYGDVKGFQRNIFFIEHKNEESCNEESRSYSNEHEAKFIAALAKHLLKQGYMRSQITILTPYVGQVLLIRRLLPKKEFEGLRVTAVDNFQGEENDIILLSLVRSSNKRTKTEGKKNPIGFLSIDNRVCVALSRAKMGFYVIGNFQLLLKYSDLWRKIVTSLQGTHEIGTHLSLGCQVHGTTINVACDEDFNQSPDGGCKLPCNAELPNCQHRCKRYCHIIDLDHKSYKCFQACNKLCTFEKVIPMCKHKELIPCHKDPFTWKCKAPCKTHLACGHACKGVCYLCAERRSHQQPCTEEIETILGCGHVVKIPCNASRDDISCSVPCGKELPCSHQCSGTCGKCFGGKLHHGCDVKCDRFHSCGHRCESKCSSLCPPCSKLCRFTCLHDVNCSRKCGERCTDCNESCAIKCKHGKCSKLCYETCDFRCDQPCLKELKCGHLCKGLCGEECLCICCEKQKVSDVFDTGISQESIFIRLSNCLCILEITGMDEWMKTSPGRGFLLSCPKCRRTILNSRRYKDVIRKCFLALHETYKHTYGTDHDRRIAIMELKSKISNLSSIGCNDSEKERLVRFLENEPLASLNELNSIGTKIKYLSCILSIERFVQIHIPSLASDSNIHTAMNSVSKYRNLLAQDRYRGFQTKHFWVELGQELRRLEYLFKFAYIDSLRTRISLSEAVIYELPKVSAYLDDPTKYDKVRLLFQFASTSAQDSGISIPPLESLNL